MNIVKINNKVYDVLVTSLSESFNILYSENTGRTMSQGARMTLDSLGCFIGHKITFKRKQGFEKEYDELYEYISQPRNEGIWVEIVHNQETIKYEAYISNGERPLTRYDQNRNKAYWGEFSVNIIPMEAQKTVE